MKLKGYILMLFFLPVVAKAQHSIYIYGQIKSENGIGIENATVVLAIDNDSLTLLSDKTGNYHFQIPKPMFKLIVSAQGYEPWKQDFRVPYDTSKYKLPDIALEIIYKELTPYTIEHIKPYTVKEDTIDYHVKAFNIRPGSNLDELLKKLPGLDVDMDDQVFIMGKKIVRVMIDGKDFPADVLTAIKNLPVDLIDRIQILDDYGNESKLTGIKLGESNKILNIILKKDKKNSQIAQLQLGVGNENKYNSTIFTDIMNKGNQFSLNGALRNQSLIGNQYERGFYAGYNAQTVPKYNVSLFANDFQTNSTSQNSVFSNMHLTQSTTTQNSTNNNWGKEKIHSLGGTITYTPNTNSVLRINPMLSFSESQIDVATQSNTTLTDSGFSKYTNSRIYNSLQNKNNNTGIDINYDHSFPKSNNKISLEVKYSKTERPQTTDIQTISNIKVDTQSIYSSLNQQYQIDNSNKTNDLTGSMHYYLSLGTLKFLNLGYQLNLINNQNYFKTGAIDSSTNELIPIDSLTNSFTTNTYKSNLSVDYLMRLPKLNISFGITGQNLKLSTYSTQSENNISNNWFKILPHLDLNYAMSSENKITINLSSSTLTPSANQLMPVANISNVQNPVTGNPNLQPSTSQSLKFEYSNFLLKPTWYQSFTINMIYNNVIHPVIGAIIIPQNATTVIQETTFINANRTHNTAFNYYLNLNQIVRHRISISLRGNMTSRFQPVASDGVIYQSKMLQWSQNAIIKMEIPQKLESEFRATYSNSYIQFSPGTPYTVTPSANWQLRNRLYIYKKWILSYSAEQNLNAGNNHFLISQPMILNMALERDLFAQNNARFSIEINNLSNSSSGTQQSITPISLSINRTHLLGRYFQVKMSWKLQRVRK